MSQNTPGPETTLRVVYSALIVGAFSTFGVLAYVGTQNPPPGLATEVRWALAFGALFDVVLAGFVQRHLRAKALSEARQDSRPFVVALFPSVIVGAAMREAAAIIGGLIVYLSGDVSLGGIVLFGAVLTMAMSFPSAGRLRAWQEEHQGRLLRRD